MRFDVFVSYKSENANQARAVTDNLTSRGLSELFAEYEIRSAIFDNDIQAAIDRGIDNSEFFLLFIGKLEGLLSDEPVHGSSTRPRILSVTLDLSADCG